MRRNVSTVGGELATRSPYSDLTTAWLALDAAVVVATADGSEVWPLTQYLIMGREGTPPAGLLTEVRLPAHGPEAKTAFLRLSQIPSSPTILNAAALLVVKDGLCEKACLALGAAEPAPVRLALAEAQLEGQPLDPARFDRAIEKAVELLQPFSDTHASADYRKTVARVLMRRAVQACLASTD